MAQNFNTYFREFEDSFNRFKETANKAKSDFEKELVVQRFLFTTGLFLEILKYLLKKRKVNCVYPSECIQKAARFGLIPAEKIYLDMLEDRYEIINLKNRITDQLYQRIKIKYVIALRTFLEKILTTQKDTK